jgi:hypothetical protein
MNGGDGDMGAIASLLFGRAAGRLFDLVTGEGGREQEMADRVARSGEWCGSTPGRGRSGGAFPAPGRTLEPDAFPRRSA